jgi:hypothetical protein
VLLERRLDASKVHDTQGSYALIASTALPKVPPLLELASGRDTLITMGLVFMILARQMLRDVMCHEARALAQHLPGTGPQDFPKALFEQQKVPYSLFPGCCTLERHFSPGRRALRRPCRITTVLGRCDRHASQPFQHCFGGMLLCGALCRSAVPRQAQLCSVTP